MVPPWLADVADQRREFDWRRGDLWRELSALSLSAVARGAARAQKALLAAVHLRTGRAADFPASV